MRLTLSLIFFISQSLYAMDCKHTETSFKCVQYLSNYDGDTIKFNIPNTHPLLGSKISIRVNGIDTAEIKTNDSCEKKMAKLSKNFVQDLLTSAKRIDLIHVKRGKYFRVVADVIVDGKSLSQSLHHYKLAYSYSGNTKPKINWCDRFQKMKRTLASELPNEKILKESN